VVVGDIIRHTIRFGDVHGFDPGCTRRSVAIN